LPGTGPVAATDEDEEAGAPNRTVRLEAAGAHAVYQDPAGLLDRLDTSVFADREVVRVDDTAERGEFRAARRGRQDDRGPPVRRAEVAAVGPLRPSS
jgi:hypothetical protein